MKIVPQAQGPIAKPPTGTPEPQQSARERAISALMKGADQSPVQNPNQVQPEELAALNQNIKGEEPKSEEPASDAAPAEAAPSEATEDPASPPEAKEEKAPEESTSSKLAMLARKEKALRAERLRLQQEKAELEAKKAAQVPTPSQPAGISLDDLAADPLGILAKAGVSWDALTQKALNDTPPSQETIALNRTIESLQNEIKELKGWKEESAKKAEEQQTQAYQNAVRQLTRETQNLVAHDPSYELVRETNSVKDVVELIEKTYKEDNYLMSVEEAATQVENYLLEESARIARLKKIQEKLRPAASAQPQATQKQAASTSAPKQPELKTLSNAVSTSRKLSARERAIMAAEGRLQK